MKTLLKAILSASSKQLFSLLANSMSAFDQMFKYLNGMRKDQKEKEAIQNKKRFDDDVDTIVDNGSIEDLIELKRKL